MCKRHNYRDSRGRFAKRPTVAAPVRRKLKLKPKTLLTAALGVFVAIAGSAALLGEPQFARATGSAVRAPASMCERVAQQGTHAWEMEAARMTARTGIRHTVSSLQAVCAAK